MEPNNNKLQRTNIVLQQNKKILGEQGLMHVHKKLSQFDSFQYLSKLDASQWVFGKDFVIKFCNR
jgi:hypothetical protein